MIFNTIHKELQNFNHLHSVKRQCSINYNAQQEDFKHVFKQQSFNNAIGTYKDKNIVRQCIKYEGQYISKPIKKLSPQKTIPMKKSQRKPSKKRQNIQTIKMQRTRNSLSNRCHPQKYSRVDLVVSPKKKSEIFNSQISHGLANHLSRSQHNRNLGQIRGPFQYNQQNRQKQNSLSQTAISGGSQLYELSPIHFNKYMEYKDKLASSRMRKEENKQETVSAVEVHKIYDEAPINSFTTQTVIEIQYKTPSQIQKPVNRPAQINSQLYQHRSEIINKAQCDCNNLKEDQITFNGNDTKISNSSPELRLQTQKTFMIWSIILLLCGVTLVIAQIIK